MKIGRVCVRAHVCACVARPKRGFVRSQTKKALDRVRMGRRELYALYPRSRVMMVIKARNYASRTIVDCHP